MESFLVSKNKEGCYGCGACAQICPKSAIKMSLDDEGFRYPSIDTRLCIHCDLCKRVCPALQSEKLFSLKKSKAFGGYNKSREVLNESTSGGAFSAIVDDFCVGSYLIIGVSGNGFFATHIAVDNKEKLSKLRQSKYVQSDTGNSFILAKKALLEGKKVLFSGTPCQIAGLRLFLGKDYENLLTVEVVCEGVPSPLFIEKKAKYIESKKHKQINSCIYRFKNKNKWDFERMRFCFIDGSSLKEDRWFNPFWDIWLNHLMSRPSCYKCPFAREERVADITLGDLWGTHIYCPDLYNNNRGASLMLANTEKGLSVIQNLTTLMTFRELDLDMAIKYQSPLRHPIARNNDRSAFMNDLKTLDYPCIIQKWHKKPTMKLLFNKYVWGNRQKVFIWNLTHRFTKKQ